jgi:hypothetical protein
LQAWRDWCSQPFRLGMIRSAQPRSTSRSIACRKMSLSLD